MNNDHGFVIKSCPFCGEIPNLYSTTKCVGNDGFSKYFVIECEKCHIKMSYPYQGQDVGVYEWMFKNDSYTDESRATEALWKLLSKWAERVK